MFSSMKHGKHLMMKQQICILLSVSVCACVCLPVGNWKVQWIADSEMGVGSKQPMEGRDSIRDVVVLPFKPLVAESDSDRSYAVLLPEQYHSPSPFSSYGDTTALKVRQKSDSTQTFEGKHLQQLSIKSNTGGIYSQIQSDAEDTPILKTLTHRYNIVQQGGTGGILTITDQVNFAELKSESQPLTKQSSEMVVVSIATAIAALFSLSIMAALFGCCCRKKRQSVISDSRDSLKESSENGTSPRAVNQKQEPSTDTNNIDVRNDSGPKIKQNGDGDGLVLSVKDKIKAFESQQKSVPVTQMTESPRQPKKRPLSEAYKHFETTGILIGMGKSTKPAVEVREDTTENEGEEIPGTDHNHIPAITEVSPAPDAAKHKEEKEEDIPEIYNPDVVIASEDDDDDEDEFAPLQRETEVLKSFRRAPPPRNRSPATRASRQQLEDDLRPQKKDSPAKEPPSLDSKSEKIYSVVDRLTPDKVIKDNSASNKTNISRMASPGANSQCRLTAEVGTSKEDNRTSKSASGSVENIFYLIDPTVKSKSVGDVQKSPSVDKVKKLQEDRDLKHNQELTQALKHKMQKGDKESSPAQKQEDDHSPMKRERTQSDPSRKSETFLQTKV